MKKIILLTFSIFIFSCSATLNNKVGEKNSANIAAQYVSGSDDIPLYEGLTQTKDDFTNFDTMSGNIVISIYSGKLKLEQVKKFYLETLPQLGWKLIADKNNSLSYKRNNERLKVSLKIKNGELVVKFFTSSSL